MPTLIPQFLVNLDSPRALDMLEWLVMNCGLEGWGGKVVHRRWTTGSLGTKLWSKVSMSDDYAVMFKLMFPEVEALSSMRVDELTETVYFVDDKRYQRLILPHVDFWQRVPEGHWK